MVAIFIPSATISSPGGPGVYVPQPTAVPLIHRRITTSTWIIHIGAQGIHLVIIAMSIECKHHVCVIGLLTSCIVKSSSGAGRRREGNHPPAPSCKNCPRMTCREANTLRPPQKFGHLQSFLLHLGTWQSLSQHGAQIRSPSMW